MAKISRDEILKLAKLARLELGTDEVDKFANEMSSIMDYVEVLNSVDTDGLKPTYQVTGLENVARFDELIDYDISQAELLKNLPERQDDLIKAKRMIG